MVLVELLHGKFISQVGIRAKNGRIKLLKSISRIIITLREELDCSSMGIIRKEQLIFKIEQLVWEFLFKIMTNVLSFTFITSNIYKFDV